MKERLLHSGCHFTPRLTVGTDQCQAFSQGAIDLASRSQRGQGGGGDDFGAEEAEGRWVIAITGKPQKGGLELC